MVPGAGTPSILTDENIALFFSRSRKRHDGTSIKRQFLCKYFPVFRPLFTVPSTLYGLRYRNVVKCAT
jgi:hypothetical protein